MTFNPELSAQITLAVFALVAVGSVVWHVHRSKIGWGAWLLYALDRTYGATFFHWRSDGRCPFADEPAAMIIANHRSPIDPLMVWLNHHLGSKTGRIRVINFMMAKEYYEMPGLSLLCKSVQSIPVVRDGKDVGPIREVLTRLRKGNLVCVFPEGGINRDETGRLQEGNPGFAWLALRAKVPVYPVFIHDAPQGGGMVAPFYRFSRVRVSYGEPIDLSPYYKDRKSPEVLNEVTALMMKRLGDLGGVGNRNGDDEADEFAENQIVSMDRATG